MSKVSDAVPTNTLHHQSDSSLPPRLTPALNEEIIMLLFFFFNKINSQVGTEIQFKSRARHPKRFMDIRNHRIIELLELEVASGDHQVQHQHPC